MSKTFIHDRAAVVVGKANRVKTESTPPRAADPACATTWRKSRIRLAHDLARSITERSGQRTPAVTYLPDQHRFEITHPDPIFDTDAAAVARYIRITQLGANLAALDAVASADCAVSLASELHMRESYAR
ncbi:hypothetical protein BH92_10685 [Rhodococcoides fascians A21d2]|uniref:hypothetical protein n=1 Tax=Rhodococcoides fascians TaxID=1828 RepID=UPI00055D837B|nr:hypothetical protein [Rhodococcus fascians]QII00282.1 hypothetical protein BH92_10685 [Rhodococcus fascians A21d2]